MRACSDVMTKNPTCCTADDPVTRAAEIMKTENVGAVPVVDSEANKKLIGIVTDRDLVLKVVADNKSYSSTKVQEVMTSNPVTCFPDDKVQDVIDRMGQHQIRRIPVVDPSQRIAGIISLGDVAVRVDQPKQTAEALEELSQPV